MLKKGMILKVEFGGQQNALIGNFLKSKMHRWEK